MSPDEQQRLPRRLNRLLLEDAYPQEIEIDRMIDRDGKGNQRNCQAAFPLMVKELLPRRVRGLVVAGLLSALMGSLAGVFNACSTLFTVDLYEKWKPKATQQQLVRTGRIATTVMVLIALAWIPVVKGANSLYEYLQQIQGYLAPPIFVVFFLGVFFKRLNAKGCWWAMVVGFVMGVFRMAVDTPVTMKLPGFEEGYHEELAAVDHQQHQLPVLQHPDHDCFRGGDGDRELHDVSAVGNADPQPDLRHDHRGRQADDASELGLARRGRLGLRAGGDYRSVFVFPRLMPTSHPPGGQADHSRFRADYYWVVRRLPVADMERPTWP